MQFRPAPPARALRFVALVLVLMLACASPVRAQSLAGVTESAVKAAFLSKFPGFVDWPPGVLSAPDEPVVIATIGDDDIAADLLQIAAARPAGAARPITVRKLPAGGMSGIHVLFIGATREARVRELTAQVRGPVLVVTEQEDGLRLGGVLNLAVEGGKVRFAASTVNAEARGLRLSARLLALAQTVDGKAR